jgi:hypothetical protein
VSGAVMLARQRIEEVAVMAFARAISPLIATLSGAGLPLVAWTHRLKEDGDGRNTQEV